MAKTKKSVCLAIGNQTLNLVPVPDTRTKKQILADQKRAEEMHRQLNHTRAAAHQRWRSNKRRIK